jgi:hypothetical protein
VPDSDTPTVPPPPKFDSRAAANAAYNQIMTGAARLQQLVNYHIVRSATMNDPGQRAEALDAAIRNGDRMVAEFRKARNVVAAVVPGLPPAPAPSAGGFQRPGRIGPEKPRPRVL